MTTATAVGRRLQCLLDDEIEPFLQQLRAARYADESVHRKRAIAREFAQWAQQHLIVADDLSRNSAAEFVARLPQRAKTRVALERATVHSFLKRLYTRGCLHLPSAEETGSGCDRYLGRYEKYLRKDRGLSDNSVHVYLPFIRDFLSSQAIQAGCLSEDAFDTKHEHASGKWIFGEFLLAKPRQGVNPLASVYGFNGHQHAHLRRDLDHPSASRQARSKPAQSGGAAALQWMRILPPPAERSAIRRARAVSSAALHRSPDRTSGRRMAIKMATKIGWIARGRRRPRPAGRADHEQTNHC